MCIVEVPEIVSAPVVVNVPVTSGNVEKSYAAVMVTGVGVEPDAEGAEPIVKAAVTHSAIAAETILLCRTINILCLMLIVLAFIGFSCANEPFARGYPAERGLGAPGGDA